MKIPVNKLNNSVINILGANSDGSLMKLDNEGINVIIKRLNGCVQAIENEYKAIGADLQKINSSWAAREAGAYINKVMEANANVAKVSSGMQLLSRTYSKSLVNSANTSAEVQNVVNNV